MVQISDEELIERARSALKPKKIRHRFTAGDVGCALVSARGNVYLGTSIDTACGLGFCAEQSAIAAMITHGEYLIKIIVAVSGDGKPIPPCGRCREFMYQIHEGNLGAEVIISEDRTIHLRDLLPLPWDAKG